MFDALLLIITPTKASKPVTAAAITVSSTYVPLYFSPSMWIGAHFTRSGSLPMRAGRIAFYSVGRSAPPAPVSTGAGRYQTVAFRASMTPTAAMIAKLGASGFRRGISVYRTASRVIVPKAPCPVPGISFAGGHPRLHGGALKAFRTWFLWLRVRSFARAEINTRFRTITRPQF